MLPVTINFIIQAHGRRHVFFRALSAASVGSLGQYCSHANAFDCALRSLAHSALLSHIAQRRCRCGSKSGNDSNCCGSNPSACKRSSRRSAEAGHAAEVARSSLPECPKSSAPRPQVSWFAAGELTCSSVLLPPPLQYDADGLRVAGAEEKPLSNHHYFRRGDCEVWPMSGNPD